MRMRLATPVLSTGDTTPRVAGAWYPDAPVAAMLLQGPPERAAARCNGGPAKVGVVPPRLRSLLSRLRDADARRLASAPGSPERLAAEQESERLVRAIRGEPVQPPAEDEARARS